MIKYQHYESEECKGHGSTDETALQLGQPDHPRSLRIALADSIQFWVVVTTAALVCNVSDTSLIPTIYAFLFHIS